LEEFVESIESAAKIGRWDSADCMKIAALKLTDSARTFYSTCLELHTEEATWDKFKKAFREGFKDVHTDQYHFMRLQTARQAKHESPQEFADRCRALAQKAMCKDSDPVAQRIHRENAERMLLASFVAGLSGEVGRQVKFQNPQDLRQALTTAFAVREALKQENFAETFYTKFDKSTSLSEWQDEREPAERYSPKRAANPRGQGGTSVAQIGQALRVARRKFGLEQNLGATSAKGVGTARECPTKTKARENAERPRKGESE